MKSYIIIAVLLSVFALAYNRGKLTSEDKVFFLDVGQGDSILVSSSDQMTLMIDTGPDSSVIRETLKILPSYSTIDVVLITHPDVDHIGGLLSVLKTFHVSQLLLNLDSLEYVNRNIPAYLLETTSISVVTPATSVHLSSELSINILWPYISLESNDDNTDSIVATLKSGAQQYVFTADVPQSVEHRVLPVISGDLPVRVLKAGHHGSKFSSSWYFLETLEPSSVIFSSGAGNPHGHPNLQAVDVARRVGAELHRTDSQGTIEYTIE